jgi:hypothetical protein
LLLFIQGKRARLSKEIVDSDDDVAEFLEDSTNGNKTAVDPKDAISDKVCYVPFFLFIYPTKTFKNLTEGERHSHGRRPW